MKKLLLLLFIVPLLAACGSDSNDPEPIQDYTSIQIMQNQIENQPNTIIAYKIGNTYKKLGDVGNLKKGVWSEEIKSTDRSISEIYIFSDYPSPSVRSDKTFILKQNRLNRFEMPADTKGIEVTDKSDPTQYPQ